MRQELGSDRLLTSSGERTLVSELRRLAYELDPASVVARRRTDNAMNRSARPRSRQGGESQ